MPEDIATEESAKGRNAIVTYFIVCVVVRDCRYEVEREVFLVTQEVT